MASFTHTSIGPSSASTRAAAASTRSKEATSTGIGSPSPPAASTSFAAASSPSRPRASNPTRAPLVPNAIAVARPTPADAPVTTTTFPCRSMSGRYPQAPTRNRQGDPPRGYIGLDGHTGIALTRRPSGRGTLPAHRGLRLDRGLPLRGPGLADGEHRLVLHAPVRLRFGLRPPARLGPRGLLCGSTGRGRGQRPRVHRRD